MTHVIALFSPKSGVGTTTLAYHLAHMVARKGLPTLAADTVLERAGLTIRSAE